MHIHQDSSNKKNIIFMRRIIIAGLFVVMGLSVLIARYAYLQILSHDKYATQSDSNRIKRISSPPSRGYIYDRNGYLLADNKPLYVAMLSPEKVENPELTLRLLMPIFNLSEKDLVDVLARVKKSKNDPVTIKINLTEKQIAQFSERKPFFKGINIENKLTRTYPYDDLFSHVIGYVGRINDKESKVIDTNLYAGTDLIGKRGIEKFYEKELLGKPGYKSVETDAHGKILRELETKAPTPGNDLYLSIDYGLQATAIKILKDKGEKGSVVAIDPRNGDILAFVSNPGYDPNLFITGISYKNYGMLRDDPMQPLFNRSIQGQYPPASTIKPFEGMGTIHYGLMDWDSTIHDPGYFSIPGDSHKFRDWKRSGHGTVNLKKSIVESVDTYYYKTAYRMGIDRLHDWMVKFNFGSKTGVDMPGENPGVMPSSKWKKDTYDKNWLPGDTISASIGQGYFLATPLQVANATAMIANKGQHLTPHLVKSYKGNLKMKTIAKSDSQIKFNGTEQDWLNMHDAMESTVRYGTARKIYTPNYRIAGKTGTAQVKSIAQGKRYNRAALPKKYWDHAWFTGFAPVENPEIAIVVLVENGGGGSSTAAPIAKQLFDYWMVKKDHNPLIPPNSEEIKTIRAENIVKRNIKIAKWEADQVEQKKIDAEKQSQEFIKKEAFRLDIQEKENERNKLMEEGYQFPKYISRPIKSISLKRKINETDVTRLTLPESINHQLKKPTVPYKVGNKL